MLQILKRADEAAMAAIVEEKYVRGTTEVFLLFAMGSQFDHLIRLALEKLGVYCLVADPGTVTAADVQRVAPIGIILSGGPASVTSEPPPFDTAIFDLGIPVLGICLGFQMWAKHIGSTVSSGSQKEFGLHEIVVYSDNVLFADCPERFSVVQSHGDYIELSHPITGLARSGDVVAAAFRNHLYGVQFHPEVSHSEYGMTIFENFCFRICGAQDRYPAGDVAHNKIEKLRWIVNNKTVLLGLSGGSDSSVVAHLLSLALQQTKFGEVIGLYISGLDRTGDADFVKAHFQDLERVRLHYIDATELFLHALAGKVTGREKRMAMRGVYQEIFREQVAEFGADYVAQGTLYTDLVESGLGIESAARKAVIKIHHNTGLDFGVPELTPLADCVKDGARNIGRVIGVPEEILERHPFPGPGLSVRIEGEVTREKLLAARIANEIWNHELQLAGLYESVWQAGVELTASQHTYSRGDDAGSGHVLALWAVWSANGFTTEAAELPWSVIKRATRRIGNKVPGVAAVVYRTSSKPPSTIEWE